MIIKYIDYFELYKSAKYISKDKAFVNTKLLKYFILELILTIIHPNIVCKEVKFTTSPSWNLKNVNFYMNDILLVFSIMRFYLIFFALIALSRFYNGRSDSIW